MSWALDFCSISARFLLESSDCARFPLEVTSRGISEGLVTPRSAGCANTVHQLSLGVSAPNPSSALPYEWSGPPRCGKPSAIDFST